VNIIIYLYENQKIFNFSLVEKNNHSIFLDIYNQIKVCVENEQWFLTLDTAH